jgi:hypothetical protein
VLEPRLAFRSGLSGYGGHLICGSAAVVGPKKKSQDPAAKAKRIKRLLVNPDFAEAVSFERAAAKMWQDKLHILHDE